MNAFLFACGLIGRSRGSKNDLWTENDVTADWYTEASLDELLSDCRYNDIRLPGIRLWINARSFAVMVDAMEGDF